MESNKNIDISVVMPVYNSGAYLREALCGLVKQTLKDIEIICVDDGSADDSLQILGEFAKADERIRILNREHTGAGEARNAGLAEASGEYVLFLDSDDIFDETLLEKIFRKGKKTEADVVLFGAKRYDNRTGQVVNAPRYLWRKLIPEKEVFSRKDMDGRLFGLTITSPWTKLFRREFVLEQKISFQNLPNSNDVRFVLVAMAEAGRISIVREDLVYYRVFRKGSLQNKKDKDPLCFLTAYEDTYDELRKRGIYEDVGRGFADLVLSGCVFNLNTVQSEEARWAVIQALCSERFLRMKLLELPEDEYDMPQYFHKIKGLPYALGVREELKKKKDPPSETRIATGSREARAEAEPKVSVIIPVYNTQAYLAECLDSITGQTLKELEIICIDDGSEDSSFDLLLSRAEKDSRIRVYRQENCGLSVTRNRGLSHASGEYVYFMDSDDTLRKDALEKLYERSRENGLEVLYFDGMDVYEREELRNQHPEFQDFYLRKGDYPMVCAGTEMFMQMRGAGEYRTNVGIAFFQRAYLVNNELSFEPGILHEDNDFTFSAMLLAERAGYVKETLFQRRIREASIMTADTGFRGSYGYFKGFLNMLAFLNAHSFPEEMTELLYGTLCAVLDHAKIRYSALSGAEKCASMGLFGAEQIAYRIVIEGEALTHAKMKRAFQEKSEINSKLQITYQEKYDRGLEIKRLKKELEAIKSSETYRLARVIGLPVRALRRALRRLKGQAKP